MSGTSNELVCRTDGRRVKVRAAQLGGVDAVEVGDDGLTLTVTFLGKAPARAVPGEHTHRRRPPDHRHRGRRGVRRARGGPGARRPAVRHARPDRRHLPVHGSPSWTPIRTGGPAPSPFPASTSATSPRGVRLPARLPDPLRLQGRAARLPAGLPRRAGHRLHGARLRHDPPPDPGPAGADHARTGSSATPPTSARRSSSCSPTPPTRSATSRTRWPRRRISTPPAAGSPYAAMSGSSTTRCTTASTHVPSSRSRPYGDADAAARARSASPPSTSARLGPRDRPETGTVIDDRDLAVLDERGSVEVFEPVVADEPLELRPAHNTIRLWTWGDEVCSLPKGATSATLRDEWADEECQVRSLELAPGDLLRARGGAGGALRHAGRRRPRPPSGRAPHLRHPGRGPARSTSRSWRSPGPPEDALRLPRLSVDARRHATASRSRT